ncbi:AAA family ATPase [Francisella frigiditurris]|uniref:6-phosphofructo-2-kinase family protein n=1 Tax=Francisella frigiditurris TaxID=1542390 RepID=A0A1J0KVX7_9GAMM|nr:AAA family ATPase [Francisella frigiditurris]APC97976.1 6-phosphofructo-2-kinase family protein [Francisella frigiditurris]
MLNAYIFSGLPGVGKTTLAKRLAQAVSDSVYYRIDTIEYYLKKEYSKDLIKQGYEITYYLAKENLELGKNVIIDCCNPVKESRELWNKLSTDSIKVINIEVLCSNKEIHENRIESRFEENKNKYPSWQSVLDRDYENWFDKDVIRVDTANIEIKDSLDKLMKLIKLKNEE